MFLFSKKWANPGLFFIYFQSFQTNINTIFTINQCEKMSMASSIWYRDSNPQPLNHESTPITTRPGLPPECILYYVPSCNEETVTVWLHCFALLHIRRQVWRGAYHRDLFLAIGLLDLYCDHHHLLKTCHNWRKNFSSTAWWWRRLHDFADSQFAGSSRAIF